MERKNILEKVANDVNIIADNFNMSFITEWERNGQVLNEMLHACKESGHDELAELYQEKLMKFEEMHIFFDNIHNEVEGIINLSNILKKD